MRDFFNKLSLFKNSIIPVDTNEDDFNRIAVINGLGALLLGPIFTLLLYLAEAPPTFVLIAVSYPIGFIFYATLCWYVRSLRDQLVYLLFFHLFVITFFAINELTLNGFKYNEVVYAMAFYVLSTIIIQRLYPAILYNVFVVVLLTYLYKMAAKSEVPLEKIIPFFILFGLASILMIYSRNRIKNKLKEYSTYLRKIISNPGSGYILFRIDESKVRVYDMNNIAAKYFNLTYNDLQGLASVLNKQLSAKSRQNLSRIKLGNLMTETIPVQQYGRMKTIELKISVVTIRKRSFLLANLNDITEQSRKRQELIQNEKKYRNLYYKNRAGVFTLDKSSTIVDANDSFFKMFDGTLKRNDELFIGRNKADWNFILETLKESDSLQNYQTQYTLKTGVIKSFIFSWYNDDHGKKIVGSVIDLTSIQQASQALKQSEQKYKIIFEESNDAILILNGDRIVDANRTAQEMFDKSLENIKKLTLLDLTHDRDVDTEKKLLKHKQSLLKNRNTKFQWLFESKLPDQPIEAEVSLIEITLQNELFYQCVIHDQTEQNKLAKEKLRAEFAEEANVKLEAEIKERIKAERRLQDQFLRTKAILDSSSNTFLITLDLSKKITSFNYHSEKYFDEILQSPIIIGEGIIEPLKPLLPKRQIRLFSVLFRRVVQGESHQIEVKFIGPEEREYWLDIFMNPIFDTKGRVAEVSLVAHDISEKKKSSIEIVESLKEKEVLLKEIHHRVKNNLQVISSILSLQSSFIHDEETINILEESRNRVRSMAIIHENLYKTEDFSSIKFGEYLQNLIANLIASYNISGEILLNSEVEEVYLVLDQAIPCGLLVNEIITNSLKYAWDGNSGGTIELKLYQEGTKVHIELGDDGKGLPADFNELQEETLGLQLVLTLVEQLDGTLQVENKNGTKYLLTFDNIKTLSNVKN